MEGPDPFAGKQLHKLGHSVRASARVSPASEGEECEHEEKGGRGGGGGEGRKRRRRRMEEEGEEKGEREVGGREIEGIVR